MEPSKRFARFLEKFFPYRFELAKLVKGRFIRWIYYKIIFEKNNLKIVTVVECAAKAVLKSVQMARLK